MANISLPNSQYSIPLPRVHAAHIDLSILETLLQILIDRLIRHFANQSKIRNSHFLLLCGIEGRFFDIRFTAPASRLSGLIAFGPPTYSLQFPSVTTLWAAYIFPTMMRSCVFQCGMGLGFCASVNDGGT